MRRKIILPVKGMRDFYPEKQAFLNWLYQNVKELSENFGYQEYEGPIIEPLELYAAKSGATLVKKQAFCWRDKSGKKIVLRPELTPTLARMIAQKENQLVFPLRWFSFGRFFRYEKPQKARGREFFQWNLDIIGSNSLVADAEVISISAEFLKKLAISPKQVKIKINDRQILFRFLQEIKIRVKKFLPLVRIIDKNDKVKQKEFLMLKEIGLNQQQIESLEKFLNNKTPPKTANRLQQLMTILKTMNIAEYVEYDPRIVRGLDYYTSTVFEAWAIGQNLRALWGGGRYDNLLAAVGSKKTIPGVGFAMGDMVIEELLKSLKKYPSCNPLPSQVLVTVFSPKFFDNSAKIADLLRKNNIKTELFLEEKKIDKQLKYADRQKIPWVIILGPEEVKENLVVLKDMSQKTQARLTLKKAIEKIVAKIAKKA